MFVDGSYDLEIFGNHGELSGEGSYLLPFKRVKVKIMCRCVISHRRFE